MILYFLRHGKAGASNRVIGIARDDDDDARELTAAGEEELRRAGPLWRQLNCRPEVVITSPLPRALRTAELFCEAVGGDPEIDDRLRPGARWSDLARAMAAHPDARRVMFVGHEPDLSSTIAELSGASSVRMRKGGLACLEFYGVPEPGTGELAWLIDPDLYGAPHGG
ncbi:MAG: phosphoglycerate mutase family protein [Chloroflexota bacterium]